MLAMNSKVHTFIKAHLKSCGAKESTLINRYFATELKYQLPTAYGGKFVLHLLCVHLRSKDSSQKV